MNVLMLCNDSDSSKIMFNAIRKTVNVCYIITEEKDTKKLLKRRLKKLGVVTVFGQVLFIIFAKYLARVSKKRSKEIIASNGLVTTGFPEGLAMNVKNINSEEVINKLKEINPDAVVVNGTSILSSDILNSISKPFINTHLGITPKYRGVHGGYYALILKDNEHCGVTVHLVDEGIDTGSIVYQDIIKPSKKDNFSTYPLLQLAKALPLMCKTLNDIKNRSITTKKVKLPSMLWSHPTLFSYIFNRIFNGVK
jgi:folate-dependent phosphoribosylglycinamide formyltransferase PurN